MKSVLILWLSAWFANVTASEFVDQMEPLLRQNRDFHLSGRHTSRRQAAALMYFDQQWTWGEIVRRM